MTARKDRLTLEIEMAKKAFSNNKNVFVARSGKGLLTKCRVTYLVKGLNKLPDNTIETVERHRLEIYFPLLYPIVPPIFKFVTPIWHPSIVKGFLPLTKKEVEAKTLIDIIIFIGQIIQYREFPALKLNKEATEWAKNNKELWPNGRKNLVANKDFEVETKTVIKTSLKAKLNTLYYKIKQSKLVKAYIQSGFSMKTVLKKFVLCGLLAGLVTSGLITLTSTSTSEYSFAWRDDKTILSDYFEFKDDAVEAFSKPNNAFKKYCRKNRLDPRDENSFVDWYIYGATKEETTLVDKYLLFNNVATDTLGESFANEFNSDYVALEKAIRGYIIKSNFSRFTIFTFVLTFLLCLFERLYYGIKKKSVFSALLSGLMVAAWCLILGIIAYLINYFLVNAVIPIHATILYLLVWTLIGLGIGFVTGITKQNTQRRRRFILGGMASGFISGVVYSCFNSNIYNTTARNIATSILISIIISFALGVLEQLTKRASLRIIEGKKYGKEYLILNRKTYIGSNNENSIVLKKDLKVAPRHLVIFNDDNKFILIDYKSPIGTLVNGQHVSHAVLKHGDKITLGKSTLEFIVK